MGAGDAVQDKKILEAVLSQDTKAASLYVDDLLDYLEAFVRSHSI